MSVDIKHLPLILYLLLLGWVDHPSQNHSRTCPDQTDWIASRTSLQLCLSYPICSNWKVMADWMLLCQLPCCNWVKVILHDWAAGRLLKSQALPACCFWMVSYLSSDRCAPNSGYSMVSNQDLALVVWAYANGLVRLLLFEFMVCFSNSVFIGLVYPLSEAHYFLLTSRQLL